MGGLESKSDTTYFIIFGAWKSDKKKQKKKNSAFITPNSTPKCHIYLNFYYSHKKKASLVISNVYFVSGDSTLCHSYTR